MDPTRDTTSDSPDNADESVRAFMNHLQIAASVKAARIKAAEESDTDPLIGTKLLGHYEIISRLGVGGMGVVYKARHVILNQFAAIKFLDANRVIDERDNQRFQQEAMSASRLHHKGIVSIRDFGILAGRGPFLIMDFVEGVSLAELITKAEISPDRALRLCIQICDALGHAHAEGVVHRDLKPGNILIVNAGTPEETVRIVDFGLAQIVQGDSSTSRERITRTGETVGSPDYMSPEQCMGQVLDGRADLYSLGCTLYELLTGGPPFLGASLFAAMHQHLTAVPPSVTKGGRKFANAARLDEVILKALAKAPEQRYQTAEEFAQALTKLSSSSGADTSTFGQLLLNSKVALKRARLNSKALLVGIMLTALALSAVAFMIQPRTEHKLAAQAQRAATSSGDAFQEPFKEGSKLYNQNDMKAAVPKLEDAMRYLDSVGESDQQAVDCMRLLKDAYSKTGQYEKSAAMEETLQRVQKFYKPLGTIERNNLEITQLNAKSPQTPQDKSALADVLTRQASLYALQFKYDLAYATARTAYNLSSTASGATDPRTGQALDILLTAGMRTTWVIGAEPWQLLENLRQIAQANSSNKELTARYHFLKGRLLLLDIEHKHIKESAQNQATQSVISKLPQATFPVLRQAQQELITSCDLYQKLYDGPSPALAEALNQLGATQLALGEVSEAEKTFTKTMQISEQVRGKNHRETARYEYFLANLLVNRVDQQRLDPADSKELLLRADQLLAKAEATFQMKAADITASHSLAETQNLRGLVQFKLGNHQMAEKFYTGAINTSLSADVDPDTAKIAYQRLIELYRTSKLPEAERVQRMNALTKLVQSARPGEKVQLQSTDDLNEKID